MSRWAHVLTNIADDDTAICSICGFTHIYRNAVEEAICGTYRLKDERERYERSVTKKIIEKMGGACESCGFDDWRALHVDHKEGTGGIRLSHHKIYEAIMRGRGRNYQLLCANCNAIKASKRNERIGCYDALGNP